MNSKFTRKFRTVFFVLLASAFGAWIAITFWTFFSEVFVLGSLLFTGITGSDQSPSITEITTADMYLPNSSVKEDAYISRDGSYTYIGITSDQENQKGGSEKEAYVYTLIPRSAFEQHTNRVTSRYGDGYEHFEQKFDLRNDTYTMYGTPISDEPAIDALAQEYKGGSECTAIPMQVARNRIRIHAGCGRENRRSFMLETENMPISESDLPLYFKGSPRYTSPLSDCATFPTHGGGEKTVCSHSGYESRPCGWGISCHDHNVTFTNVETQQQTTWLIQDSMSESGFLEDGTFYALLRHDHIKGVYVVPSDYFVNNL